MREWMSKAVLSATLALALNASVLAEDKPTLAIVPLDNVYMKGEPKPVSGRVIERLPDGSLRVKQAGAAGEITIPVAKIDRWEKKQTAAEAVQTYGKRALDAGDINEIKKAVKWGLENGAKDDALTLARQAMANRSTPDLAETVVPLLIEQGDLDGAAALIKPLLETEKQWTFGYDNLARIYTQQKREADLTQIIDLWHDRQPSALTPNRYRAAAAELSGDLATAQEAYRKGFSLHNDYESGLGYARTSLKRGVRPEALLTAEALISANQFVDEARAIAGSAQLAQGAADKAEPLLTQALSGKLSPESAEMVRYNLGVIALRAGRAEDARGFWKGLTSPAAELGLAMLDRKPYQRKDLPAEMKALVAEYDACVDLESKRYDQALAQLDGKSKRQMFLAQVAALKNPTEDATRALAHTPGPESARWQAYGHILARRYTQAESALAQLPPNDGYAAVCHVFIAEAQKDPASARVLFSAVKDSIDPPREYVALLMHEYEAADDALLTEHFEASVPALLDRDWKISAPGTNIQVRTDNSRLVFEGTQSAGEDAVTRVYHEEPTAGVRWVQATLDLGGVNAAHCGIEILDSARANGVAYAVLGDNHFGWREIKEGAWGPWQSLPQEAQGTQTLRLELERGAVTAVSNEAPQIRKQLATGLFKDQQTLCVGVFGTADAGVAWNLAVKEFQVQLRGSAKMQGTKKH